MSGHARQIPDDDLQLSLETGIFLTIPQKTNSELCLIVWLVKSLKDN